MLRIRRVSARGCRGILDGPDLLPDVGGIILVGGNGSGKSSYIDVVEKVLTGRCGSLDTGDQSISWTRHGMHILATNQSISVVVTNGSKDTALSPTTDTAKLDADCQAFLSAAKCKSFILRRRTLLEFVVAKPAARYEAVENFLQLEAYSRFEAALKALRDEEQGAVRTAEAEQLRHATHLCTTLGLPNAQAVTETTCIASVNALLEKAQVDPIVSRSDAAKRQSALKVMLEGFGAVEKLQQVERFSGCIGALGETAVIVARAGDCEAARELVNVEETRLSGHFYAEVLEQGLAWIEEDALDNCPLCDGAIERAVVGEFVRRRLEEHQGLTGLRKEAAEKRESFVSGLAGLMARLALLEEQWTASVGEAVPGRIAVALGRLKEIQDELAKGSSTVPTAEQRKGLGDLGLEEIGGLGSTAVAAIRRTLPEANRFAAIHAAHVVLSAMVETYPQLVAATVVAERARVIAGEAAELVVLAETARKSAVQALVSRVSGVASGYFERIHPGEQIGSPILEVAKRGAGSLDLTTDFHGKRGDPRGHLSDGHVDTLGLCLFLAIRRLHSKQAPELAILVLDDVVHSVDGDHRRAVAELLMSEFDDHQIIITTHDLIWFERLKEAERRLRPKRRMAARRIARWSLDAGPEWGDHLADWEWLQSAEGKRAKPADRVVHAGRCLEEMLQNLCDGLAIAVTFNMRGIYTIDPLWTPFLKRAMKRASFYAVAKEYLSKIDECRSTRNWAGAHWNEWAQALTDKEAEDFVAGVLGLRSKVYCEECQDFMRRIEKLGGVWSCEGEHLKFTE
jgi:hypothetical protein